MKKLFVCAGLLVATLSIAAQNGPVKMWEGVETLPTYKVNAPEKAPLFERDFACNKKSGEARSFATVFLSLS